MGLNLSGIGHLLRRGIDDVGSAITGQPAQSVPQAPQQPMVHAAPYQIQRPQQIPSQQISIAPPQLSQPSATPTIGVSRSIYIPPHLGDRVGLTHALSNLNNYGFEDQIRILQRSGQAGLVPHNVVAAAVSGALSPSVAYHQPSKASMFGNAVADVATGGLANLARTEGTNLAAPSILKKAANGTMQFGDAKGVLQGSYNNSGYDLDKPISSAIRTGTGQAISGAATVAGDLTGAGAARLPGAVAPRLGARLATAGKIGIAFGVPQGAAQTLQEDHPTLGSFAKNTAMGVAQNTAMPLLPEAIHGIGSGTRLAIKVAAPKYAGLPAHQVIMDPAKLDILNHAKNFSHEEPGNSVRAAQEIIDGLHQIKNDHGLDFISGSTKERQQRINQFLEQNGEAIPKLQAHMMKVGDRKALLAKTANKFRSLDSAGSASGDSPLMPFNKPIANAAEKLQGKSSPKAPATATPVSKKIVSSEGSIPPAGSQQMKEAKALDEYEAKHGTNSAKYARMSDAYDAKYGDKTEPRTGTAPSTTPTPEALAEAGLTPLPKEIRISAKQDQGSSPTKPAVSPEGTPIRLQGQPKGKQLQLTQRKLTEDNPKPSSANNTPELKDEVQQYADTFGITKQQALEDLKQMQMDKVNPKPIPEGVTAPPTIEERRQIIRDNPKQQETQNKIDLGAEDGNYKGAIAKAIFHSEERDKFVKQAALKVNKLSENDKQLFYHWEDGANIDDLLEHATNSKQLQEAIEADKNAMDYHLALDRAAGGSTLRQTNYGLPKYFKLSEKEMDEAGIPENMRFKKGNYTGFHDTSSKYHSYLDAYRKAGLEPLYDNPAEAIMQYKDSGSKVLRDQALYTALAKTVPDHVGPLDMVRDSNGRKFTQGAGRLPFAASNELQPHLKAFRDSWKSNNKVIDKTLDTALFINSKQKAALFFGAPFHYFNGFSRFVGLVGGSGHGIKLVRGTGESFGASLIPGVSKSIMAKAERDGVLQYIKENGGIIHDSSRPQHVGGGVVVKLKDAAGTISPFRLTSQNMGAFFNTMMINLGRALKEKGIESGSFEAQQAMAEYNRILGHFNDKVEGGDPTIAKLLSGGELAPHWIRTQFGLIKDAGQMTLQPGHITGKHGFGMYNAGDIARTTLIGTRLAEGAFATIVTAIALGQAPTLKSLVDRFGANPANPVPNVDLGEKDKKGRHQVIDLPTDPTGLAVGLVTDPQHFTQSRFSPGLSTAQRFITNKDWNGNPLTDPNDPNQLRDRAIGAAKGTLPIGLQNFTNPNITAKQGAMQEVGGRVKTDPNDPQVQSQKQYYANQQKYTDAIKSGDFSAIDPALKNVDPKLAADMAAKWKAYQDLNPGKDPAGNEYSRAWNALSSEQKASFLLMNDQKTGAQVLSPIFYIQKQEALADPNRPHTPLYDLKGNDGVGFTLDANKNVVGTSAQSRAQTALNYQNEADPAMKALEYAANPWLKDYEKNLGNYSANYIPIMTDYMQKQGWTQPAIDDYWKKHAQDAPPISSPTIDAHTQKLMDDYGNITDPTQKAQFFQDNSAELSKAFTALAMYHNQKAVAEGHLPEQTYPTPNANAALGLTQLQKNPNHDKAIGKANALLIQNNPDLAQYLADSGLYNLAKDAARYQFQDPAHPGMNAGQLLNLDRPIDQSTMGAIQNVGKYDIGKDANGKFSFLGAGGTGKFSDGTASGSGGGYSKKSKHIKIVKRRAIKERAYKPTRLHHQTSRTVKTPYSNLKFKHKTKISIAKANKPGNVKIA